MFDLFYDAGHPAAAPADHLINAHPAHPRWPIQTLQMCSARQAEQTQATSESFYRWMVPTNNAPTTWFFNKSVPDSTQHANSHLAPGPARNDYFNQMAHNNQLNEPTSTANYDDAHFWLTKPFSPFVRTRTLKFWSAGWES